MGHAVQHCMLSRSLLSVFSSVYRFINDHLEHPAELWYSVKCELGRFRRAMFLCVCELGSPMSEEIYCSDSSKKGYALHISRIDPADARAISAVRERWRFLPEGNCPVAVSYATDFTPGWSADFQLTLDVAPGPVVPPCNLHKVFRGTLHSTHLLEDVQLHSFVPPLPDSMLVRSHWGLVVEGAWR